MSFAALDIAYFSYSLDMVGKGIMVFTDSSYSTNFDQSVGWESEEGITVEQKQK